MTSYRSHGRSVPRITLGPRSVAALTSTATLAAAGGAVLALASAPAGADAPIVVDSLADDTTVDALTTLREAILAANAAPGHDVITFSVTGAITLTADLPTITEELDVTGPGSASLAIDGASSFQVFEFVIGGGDVRSASVTGLTVHDAYTHDHGAAVDVDNVGNLDLVLADLDVFDNHSARSGGAIRIWYDSGNVTLTDVVATGNSSGAYGGALYVATLTSSRPVTISGSAFLDNTALGGSGGGIALAHVSPTVTDTVVAGNSAGGGGPGSGGGGIWMRNVGDTTLTGVTVSGNVVDGPHTVGGGVRFAGAGESELVVTASSVVGNTVANGGGGGLWVQSYGPATVAGSTVAGNVAGYYGGGLYLANAGVSTVVNSTISGNSSSQAGAVFVAPAAALGLVQSTVTANTASITGGPPAVGGVLVMGGPVTCGGVAGCSAGPATPVPGTIGVVGTILAGNGDLDLAPDPGTTVTAHTDGSLLGSVAAAVVVTDLGGTQTGVTAAALRLGPLADNGGPTLTHALLAGSPAIDAGPNPPATFPGDAWDQRGAGFARVQDGRVDVGAFEVQEPAPEPEPTFTG